MKETFEAPRNLTDAEWDVLARALGETKFGCVVETMRRRNNQPTAAQNVLPEDEINSGHDKINGRLKTRKVPFRFTRIGRWRDNSKPRCQRLLAFRQI